MTLAIVRRCFERQLIHTAAQYKYEFASGSFFNAEYLVLELQQSFLLSGRVSAQSPQVLDMLRWCIMSGPIHRGSCRATTESRS